jgi:prepilin-type N-terminal cleavage/methylation domain-containing protein
LGGGELVVKPTSIEAGFLFSVNEFGGRRAEYWMMSIGRSEMSTANSRRKGQKGFTILELLVTVMVMGILAAVILPNLNTFFGVGNLNAARTEADNVRTAAVGYYGEHHVWPNNSGDLESLVSSAPRATYIFDTATGQVIDATDVSWPGIKWSTDENTWSKS